MSQLTPDGFGCRFKACSRTLWCIATAILGDANLAEDVLQEAAMIALRKLDNFDPKTSFPAWMGQIVRYVALNHARRRANLRAVPVDPDRLNETTVPVPRDRLPLNGRGEIAPDQSSFDDRLLAALETLEETPRACLLLRVIQELPYREIARTLDIPEGTAMSHVHRARRALHETLSPGLPARIGT